MELKRDSILTKKHIALIAVSFLGYIVIALYFNSLGPNAPVMMAFYRITYTQHGFISTMQSVGSLSAGIFFLLRGERYNKFNVAAVGILLFGAGCLAIGLAPPYAALVVIVVVCGVGATTIDVMINGMIPELYPKYKNTLLPMLHAFFGTGAMASPLIVTAMVQPEIPSTFGRPLLLFGALGVCVFILFFIASRRVIPETPYADMSKIKKSSSIDLADFFKGKEAWVFLLASMLYFSFQIGIVSWLPSFGREIGMDFNTAGAMLTVFLAGSLIMRFCGGIILKRVTARKAYILFSLISAGAVILALYVGTPVIMMGLLVIGGFMQGLCIALLLLMSTEAFPDRAASASSLTFIGLSVAAMVTPLWMGSLARFTGFRIPLLLVCALLATSGILILLAGKKRAE